jgi:hypothetical protein
VHDFKVIQQAWELRKSELREEGRLEAMREGTLEVLTYEFGHRLRRDLTETERAILVTRIDRLGAERVGNVVLDLDTTQLASWLADPAAR